MMNNGSLSTEEIALAVFLTVCGHRYTLSTRRVRGEGVKCVWVFPDNEQVRDLMLRYTIGRARIEPRTFARTWGVVRREMNEYLDG